MKGFCSHQGLEHVVRLFVRYLQELTDTDSPIRDKAVKQDVRGPESTHSESGEVPGSLRNRLTRTLTPCVWTGSAEDRTRTGCVGVLCPPAGLQSEAEEASGGRWWSTVRAEHLEEQNRPHCRSTCGDGGKAENETRNPAQMKFCSYLRSPG